jgi:hypothetical protein
MIGLCCSMALIVLVVVTAGVHPAPADTQTSSTYSVTVTPTADVTDGRQLTVNVKTDPANANPVYRAQAYVCRPNVSYQPSTGAVPSLEGLPGGANCPPTGLSTSAQPIVVSGASGVYTFAPTPEGESMFLRVGVGVVEWTDTTSGNVARLTCDDANPCVLLVQMLTNEGWLPFAFPLTFKTSDPLQSCGGAAPGSLTTAGSDALTDMWIGWTVATCQGTGSGAWSTLSIGEEKMAVERFAEGQVDLAYTGLGYNADAGLASGVETPRAAVAVPIGVTAATLALGNGWRDFNERKLPFSTPSFTLDEVTTLLAGGEFPFRDLTGPISLRNPELAGAGFMYSTDRGLKVGAPAEAGTTPWVFTRHFDTLRPDTWRVPDLPFLPEHGQPRGVDNSFPLATPSYAGVLTTLTGRPALLRAFGGLGPSDLGAIYVFTDLTTARAVDLTPAAIGNVNGEFVAPTRESIAAAVDTMEVTADGMRIPNPTAATGYPLTYVVYAMAPADPLTDATGACRTESQQLLADWLTYAVRDGQADMPAGLEPLTPALQAEAEQRLLEVGKSGASGCPVPPIPPPGGGGPGGVPAGAGTSGVPTSAGLPTRGPAGGAVLAALRDDMTEQAAAELTVSEGGENPGFLGGGLPSVLAAMGALIAVGGLTALAARQTGARALAPTPVSSTHPPPFEPTSRR